MSGGFTWRVGLEGIIEDNLLLMVKIIPLNSFILDWLIFCYDIICWRAFSRSTLQSIKDVNKCWNCSPSVTFWVLLSGWNNVVTRTENPDRKDWIWTTQHRKASSVFWLTVNKSQDYKHKLKSLSSWIKISYRLFSLLLHLYLKMTMDKIDLHNRF